MRPVKTAIAAALQTDAAVSELVPAAQVFSVERSTIPTLPAVEVIGVTSERVGDGPMVRHDLSCEVTVSHGGCPADSRKSAATVHSRYPAFSISARAPSSSSR